jgi:hypothetical protein
MPEKQEITERWRKKTLANQFLKKFCGWDIWQSCCIFWRFQVKILVWKSTLLTEVLVVLLRSVWGKCQNSVSYWLQLHPSVSFLIHYSVIMLSFGGIYSELYTVQRVYTVISFPLYISHTSCPSLVPYHLLCRWKE